MLKIPHGFAVTMLELQGAVASNWTGQCGDHGRSLSFLWVQMH